MPWEFSIEKPAVRALPAFRVTLIRSRVALHLEILSLLHQLAVYQRSIRRPHVRPSERYGIRFAILRLANRGGSIMTEIMNPPVGARCLTGCPRPLPARGCVLVVIFPDPMRGGT